MSRFSSYQIKLVFADSAVNIGEGPDALDHAFITVREFKDKFYPGRPWQAEYETKSEMARRRRKGSTFGSDSSNAESSQPSVTTESI